MTALRPVIVVRSSVQKPATSARRDRRPAIRGIKFGKSPRQLSQRRIHNLTTHSQRMICWIGSPNGILLKALPSDHPCRSSRYKRRTPDWAHRHCRLARARWGELRTVISRRRNNSVAFEVKRTFSEPRLQNRIYEYAACLPRTPPARPVAAPREEQQPDARHRRTLGPLGYKTGGPPPDAEFFEIARTARGGAAPGRPDPPGILGKKYSGAL
jgi:hypothetical protein